MAAARLPVCVRPALGGAGRLAEPRMMAPGRRRHRHIRRSGLNSAGSPLRPSCQNWRMTASPGRRPAEDLSLELAACRKRGIERLDVASHNQSPVHRPELQRLADEYMAATGRSTPSRIAQLKYLFRDAITAFEAENEADAQIVRALFFGDSQHRVTKSAGELLDIARRRFGFDSELRFRQARHAAFDNFADFLPRFRRGGSAGRQNPPSSDPPPDGPVPRSAAERQRASRQKSSSTSRPPATSTTASTSSPCCPRPRTSRSSGSRTSRWPRCSGLALARKRAAMLRPDGCWSSVRVVFLGDDLLDRVSDERGYPDPVEARLPAPSAGRIRPPDGPGVPARASRPGQLGDLRFAYFPPLIGTLFEMPDGRRIVQLLIRRRQRSPSDHLFLELDDTRGHYFSAVFDEIMDNSIDDNKVVPAGVVVGERFRATSTRYRRSVLLDGSGCPGLAGDGPGHHLADARRAGRAAAPAAHPAERDP